MNKKGVALVTVLMVIGVIMALIGILYYSLNTNLLMNLNFKSYLNDFYISDGALKLEDVKTINLDVSNILEPNILESGIGTFPDSSSTYKYEIKYEFFKENISPGTSLNMFNDYFYSIKTDVNNVQLKEFVSKIGPKIQ